MSEKAKIQCKFMHFRNVDLVGSTLKEVISPSGGATIAYITDHNGRHYAAAAYCSPVDNFCFRLGREKSRGRLTGLLDNPARHDGDKYFVSPEGETADDFINRIYEFMVIDMGYNHRGRKENPKGT